MREASYSYVLYLVSIGEDIAYLQTPSKTMWAGRHKQDIKIAPFSSRRRRRVNNLCMKMGCPFFIVVGFVYVLRKFNTDRTLFHLHMELLLTLTFRNTKYLPLSKRPTWGALYKKFRFET